MLFTIRAKNLPSNKSCLLNMSVFHGVCVISSVAPYHVVTGLVTPPHIF